MGTPINQSVLKAFALLGSFSAEDEWLTSAELSRRAKLPGASGYRLVQTLEKVGAVVRGARGRYRPGMLLVSVSPAVEVGERLRDMSDAILADLAVTMDLTVHMGVLDDGMVTYVAKHGGKSAFAVHTEVGAQLEAYCSGLGKVLLAALPQDQLDGFIMDGDLVALTPFTITDRTALRAELQKVRSRGYAVDDREIRADMRCLAVPIHDADGRVVAAMSSTDHAERMTESRQTEVRIALQEAARALECKVFPPGPTVVPSMSARLPAAHEMPFAAAHG